MAGEDIDLKILIKAFLDSNGFVEAQAYIKGVSDASGKAAPPIEALGKSTKKLTAELGGSRGAVADMTRVLLQNIGVTGAAGQVAKAAGIGMTALGGAINPVTLGAAALVAGAALLIPKIIEWMNGAQRLEEENRRLRDTLISQLSSLREYNTQVEDADSRTKAWADTLERLALDKQSDEIKSNRDKLEDLNKQLDKARPGLSYLVVLYQMLNPYLKEFNYAIDQETEETKRLKNQIDALVQTLGMQAEAQAKGITLEELMIQKRKAAAAAATAEKKALDDEIASTEHWLEVQNAVLAHEREMANFRADFIEGQEKQGDATVAAGKKILAANDARARSTGKLALQEARAAMEERRRTIEKMDLRDLYIQRAQAATAAELRMINDVIAAKRAEQASIAQMWTAAITTMVGAFTKNKAINIAAAIADTAAAAVKALNAAGGWPWGVAPMALTIAMGMAQVQNIRKTNIGFDDPFADVVAAKMGRQSAEDFARHFGGMFSAALPGAMAQQITQHHYNTTINRGTTITGGLHSHAIVGSKATNELKQLNRRLIEMKRLEGRTQIGG